MDDTSPRNRIAKEQWIIAAVAAGAALVMVFYGFRAQGLVRNAGDPYQYGAIAHGFVEHGFNQLTRRAAMLYPHLLWGVYELGGNDFVVQLIHVALHVSTCSLVFIVGRHLFNARTGFLAAIATALHPMLLRYVADLHTETLLVFMSVLMVWLAIRFYDRPTVGRGIALGVVGMLAAIAKGVLLPFMLAFIAISVWRGLRRQPGTLNPFPGIVAIGVTMAVVVAPWTYRNYAVSGHFVLITPGMPDAFLRGYIFTRKEFATLERPPYTDAENESNALFRRIARENGTTWEKDEVQDDVNNGKVMKQMIREHPVDTVRKVVVGFFTFWYEMTTLKNSLIPAVLAIGGWVLAFLGFKRARAENRPFWLLLLPIVVLNAFVALLVPLGRYSVPILPFLMILAAFGVDTLLEGRKVREQAVSPTSA